MVIVGTRGQCFLSTLPALHPQRSKERCVVRLSVVNVSDVLSPDRP